MKTKNDDFIKQSLEELASDKGIFPSSIQKQRMLAAIQSEVKITTTRSRKQRLKDFIVNRPYRFAFSFSAVQAVICALAFGNDYTEFILKLFE
ncbi:hypothetical protein ACYSNR_16960 [Enterococcus sp. LJL128]